MNTEIDPDNLNKLIEEIHSDPESRNEFLQNPSRCLAVKLGISKTELEKIDIKAIPIKANTILVALPPQKDTCLEDEAVSEISGGGWKSTFGRLKNISKGRYTMFGAAGGAGAGAATGAVVGGCVGSFFGGVGAIPGTVVGAGVGGITGAVAGGGTGAAAGQAIHTF